MLACPCTSAIARSAPAFTSLSRTTTPCSRPIWPHRVRPCLGMSSENFENYLKCGRLEHGFLRVRCDSCHAEYLVAFSCRRRGFCPSCGARRIAESAALLVDEVLPEQPIRQWVLNFPFPMRLAPADRKCGPTDQEYQWITVENGRFWTNTTLDSAMHLEDVAQAPDPV